MFIIRLDDVGEKKSAREEKGGKLRKKSRKL